MAASQKDIKAFTARFPSVLYITIQSEVARRKARGEPKISVQDWLLEAVREKLYPDSGPEQRNPVQNSDLSFSAEEVARQIQARITNEHQRNLRERARAIAAAIRSGK